MNDHLVGKKGNKPFFIAAIEENKVLDKLVEGYVDWPLAVEKDKTYITLLPIGYLLFTNCTAIKTYGDCKRIIPMIIAAIGIDPLLTLSDENIADMLPKIADVITKFYAKKKVG